MGEFFRTRPFPISTLGQIWYTEMECFRQNPLGKMMGSVQMKGFRLHDRRPAIVGNDQVLSGRGMEGQCGVCLADFLVIWGLI